MMTEPHDFDALSIAANRGNSRVVGERGFVRAALSLEAWYFIGVAPEDAPDEIEPLMTRVQQSPHVLAFTDEERAEGFARARAAQRGDAEPAPVLHMAPAEAVEYLDQLREAGVQGAHFNDGDASVTCDSARIVDIARSGG